MCHPENLPLHLDQIYGMYTLSSEGKCKSSDPVCPPRTKIIFRCDFFLAPVSKAFLRSRKTDKL